MKLCITYCYIFFLLIIVENINGQSQALNTTTVIPAQGKLNTKKEYLDYLSEKYGWTFSYNASLLNVAGSVQLNYQISTLSSVLDQIFNTENVQAIFVPPQKIILQYKGPKVKEYMISGLVTDTETGESIYGAIISEKHSGISVLTNEKGYFVIKIPGGYTLLEASYLAYKKSSWTQQTTKNATINFALDSDNFLDTIVIDNPQERLQLSDGGNIMDLFKTREFKSITGESDIIHNTRILPGVQSGGEGMSGLFVRGGTPDQNLVLLDGVAMYETSHIAGISSIFVDETIKDASFIKNGFPARFGGRLSSVLDIHLKEGDKKKHQKHIDMGLASAKMHFNGPLIKDKLTYNFTARTSWLNFYVNNLLRQFTKYDDINLQYHDLLGKTTYHFSPSNVLSLTLYHGNDRMRLTKNTIFEDKGSDYVLNVFDRNGLQWGNRLASLKWNYLVGDQLSIKTQAGYLQYKNGSRSSYIFESFRQDSSRTDELDVITSSNITDYNFKVDADYYLNDLHVLRAGINFTSQKFNPTIKQSTIILEGAAENITDRDSSYAANQWQIYLEDNFKWNEYFFAYAGLHFNHYHQGSKNYPSIQPRFKVIWTPWKKHMFSAAYSRMVQNIHLLTNSGLGLPSDLWVPSTEKIRPQSSDHWSATYTLNFNKGFYLNLGAYTRTMENLLEYTSPAELFYFLINEQNIAPVFNTSKDWERNVIAGNGTSKGLEFLLHKTSGNTKGWISATWSNTQRTFPLINNGRAFQAAHDKTWDLNFSIQQNLSKSFSTSLNFVYNTGNAFSLATEEYESYLGIKLLNSNGKNNYRLPDFHQLSFNLTYHTSTKWCDIETSFNCYNVYNRLNAYYIYIYKNPIASEIPLIRKVSILPITPSLNFAIKF
jgi:hypothetical protein